MNAIQKPKKVMIAYNSKEWKKIHNPIFKKADKFCKSINAYDDVWFWYVAEETAKKIFNKQLIIDRKCIAEVFKWRDLGVCDYDHNIWSDFANHIKEVQQ